MREAVYTRESIYGLNTKGQDAVPPSSFNSSPMFAIFMASLRKATHSSPRHASHVHLRRAQPCISARTAVQPPPLPPRSPTHAHYLTQRCRLARTPSRAGELASPHTTCPKASAYLPRRQNCATPWQTLLTSRGTPTTSVLPCDTMHDHTTKTEPKAAGPTLEINNQTKATLTSNVSEPP